MARFVSPALVCLLTAVSLHAQDVAVHGIVTDADTGTPVAGAKVELNYLRPNFPLDTVETAAPGTFELKVKEPGTYSVAASAPGYRDANFNSDGKGVVVGDAEFEPGASAVAHEVELKLSRSSAMSGMVRDAETKIPLSRVVVRAIRLLWWRGTPQAEEENLVFTGEDGVFRFESLPPAEYAVLLGNTSPRTGTDATHAKAYPLLVWPEGDPDSMLPLVVKPGIELNLGTIDYSKVLLPRIVTPACDTEPKPILGIDQKVAGAWFKLSSAPANICSELNPIPAISSGTYRLTLQAQQPDFLIGGEEIHLRRDENGEAKVSLLPPARIDGKVSCECEKPPDPAQSRVRISLQPPYLERGLAVGFEPRVGNAFSGIAGTVGNAMISVSNIPDGLFLKQLLFDGQDAGAFVRVNPGSASSIEVILSDKPASITGTVDRGGKPTSHGYVVIANWPIPVGVNYVNFRNAEIDANGAFTVGKLPPGTYRATAVGPEQWARREMPNGVADWLASADNIVVAAGETKIIRIDAKLP